MASRPQSRRPPRRLVKRPRPSDWRDDEPMMLAEAIELLWPDGPLTIASLRTEIRKGRLPASRVAGRLFVTQADLWRLFRPEAICPKDPPQTGKSDETRRLAARSEAAPTPQTASARRAIARLKRL